MHHDRLGRRRRARGWLLLRQSREERLRLRLCIDRERRFYLHVARVRGDSLEKAARHVELATDRLDRTDLVGRRCVEASHVDHGGRIRAERRHREDREDRVVVGVADGFRDRDRRVRHDRVRHIAQEHAVAAALPLHHALVERLATIAVAIVVLRDLRDKEHVLAELAGWDLVVERGPDHVRLEEPRLRGDRAADHLCVRTGHWISGRGTGTAGAGCANGGLTSRGSTRWRTRRRRRSTRGRCGGRRGSRRGSRGLAREGQDRDADRECERTSGLHL